MAEEKFYHVTPSVNGWKVEEENSDLLLCEGTNKEDVLDCILHKVNQEEISHVIIHNREGETSGELLYNRGVMYEKNS
jgi:hypothetical protein